MDSRAITTGGTYNRTPPRRSWRESALDLVACGSIEMSAQRVGDASEVAALMPSAPESSQSPAAADSRDGRWRRCWRCAAAGRAGAPSRRAQDRDARGLKTFLERGSGRGGRVRRCC